MRPELVAALAACAIGCGGRTDLAIELPPCASETDVAVELVARVRAVDVVLLIDVTASMGEEIDALVSTFSTVIVPQLFASIETPRLGLAGVGDDPADRWEGSSFSLRRQLGSDPALVDEAIRALYVSDGGDGPEGQVVALFETATRRGDATLPCPAGTVGAFCFDEGAARIAVLASDAAFHNGPGGVYPYMHTGPQTSFDEAMHALNEADIQVLGLYSGAPGAEGYDHLVRAALDTGGSLDGEPLVLDIGRDGARLDRSFVDLVRRFVDERPLDVLARVRDGADAPIVRDLELVAIEPAGGGTRIDAARVADVLPGTLLRFRARVDPSFAGTSARTVTATVELIGDDRLLLGEQAITLTVPSRGTRCR